MKNVLFASLITIISGFLPVLGQVDNKDSIRQFAKSWADVSSEGDIDKFMEFFHEDAIIFTSGSPKSGAESIRTAYTSYFNKYKLDATISVLEVEKYNNKAYVWCRLIGTNKNKEDGEIKEIAFNHVWILTIEKGSWKFWRLIFTPANTSN